MTGGQRYGISPREIQVHNQEVTVADSNLDDKSDKTASSPDELVKDVDVKLSEEDQNSIVGGRKAGKLQQEYIKITMKEVIITGTT